MTADQKLARIARALQDARIDVLVMGGRTESVKVVLETSGTQSDRSFSLTPLRA
jgi:hypothetical protein